MALQDINNNLLGLQALANGRQQMEQEKAAYEDRKIASEALRKFYESQQAGTPDFSMMNEAVLRSPELAQNVLNHIGIIEKRQGQDAAGFISRAVPLMDNPDQFLALAQSRAQYLQQNGRDPKDTIALIDMVKNGQTDQAKKDLQGVAAALTNQGYLDKDLYGQLFNIQAPITPYQQAEIDLGKERNAIAREGNQLQRAGITNGTADQKNWAEYQRLLKVDREAARQFGIGAGFVSGEGQKLSDYVTKQIDTASGEAAQADMDSGRYATLAQQLRKAKMYGGLKSSINEYIKELSGGQDDLTSLRKNVLQIVNSEAIKNLPPGPATDKDIELARQPFPSDKASPEYMANWLEAISRLNQKKAEYASFRAEFMSKNGSVRDKDGNSILSVWKEQQKANSQKPSPTSSAKKSGGVLHVDANGNKAYVYPDGSYEEVN